MNKIAPTGSLRAVIIRQAGALTLLALSAGAAFSQAPEKIAPEALRAGEYKTDPAHTQIEFGINHLGFNEFYGLIADSRGTLRFDPARPAEASVEIEIPLTRIITTSADLDAHLRNADFFDVDKFPTATFKSTRVEVAGQTAKIHGDLTIKGVTKPVTLDARFIGAGINPMNKAETIGFEAHTTLRRSDFGIDYILPLVEDEVDLRITTAFEYSGTN